MQVCPLREDALGERRIDENAERLMESLALSEPGHHRVERRGQFPCLVGRDHRHADREVGSADLTGRVAKVDDRSGHRIGQHEAEPGRHGGGNANRYHAG